MPKSIEQNVDKSCTEVLASLFNTLRYTAIDTALLSLIALITASTMVRVLWLESQRASLEIRELLQHQCSFCILHFQWYL
jgi:hypothetical protein